MYQAGGGVACGQQRCAGSQAASCHAQVGHVLAWQVQWRRRQHPVQFAKSDSGTCM